MKKHSVIVACAVAMLAATSAYAQVDDKASPRPQAGAAQSEKSIPIFYGNTSCPVDGKVATRDLFAEIDGQRVYVCTAVCVDAVKKDAKGMMAKAYPTVTPVVAKACECGKPVDTAKATTVMFEGRKVSLCCSGCASVLKGDPVATIARMEHPEAKYAKNKVDPIDNKPVDSHVVILYRGQLIRLSCWANVDAFDKDPAKALATLGITG